MNCKFKSVIEKDVKNFSDPSDEGYTLKANYCSKKRKKIVSSSCKKCTLKEPLDTKNIDYERQ
jgi:hypothetical protein